MFGLESVAAGHAIAVGPVSWAKTLFSVVVDVDPFETEMPYPHHGLTSLLVMADEVTPLSTIPGRSTAPTKFSSAFVVIVSALPPVIEIVAAVLPPRSRLLERVTFDEARAWICGACEAEGCLLCRPSSVMWSEPEIATVDPLLASRRLATVTKEAPVMVMSFAVLPFVAINGALPVTAEVGPSMVIGWPAVPDLVTENGGYMPASMIVSPGVTAFMAAGIVQYGVTELSAVLSEQLVTALFTYSVVPVAAWAAGSGVSDPTDMRSATPVATRRPCTAHPLGTIQPD